MSEIKDSGNTPGPFDPEQPATPASVVVGAHGNAAFRVGDKPAKHGQPLAKRIVAAFKPNQAVSPTAMKIIVLVQVALLLLLWINSPFKVLPRPMEVLTALKDLWATQGLVHELLTSFQLNLEALALTAIISLALSYLTVLPFFRPITAAISKGRFLGFAGFTLVFMLLVGGGHPMKLAMLVFGETVFFVTSMAQVIADIPKEKFDHARTLGMKEWRVVWEVVILGTADRAFEVMRQNAAIGWLMLTMVEGINRGEGGIGVLLLNQNKYFRIDAVFAIQLTILVIGLTQDFLIGVVRRFFCPYAELTLERKSG